MKRDKMEPPEDGAAGAGPKLPSVEDCRRLKPSMREHLEQVDEELRRILNRVDAQRPRSAEEQTQFMRASATVMATVAAGILEIVAERTREPYSIQTFGDAARDAAQWTQSRRQKSKRKKK